MLILKSKLVVDSLTYQGGTDMQTIKLDQDFSISDQITVADIQTLKEAGIKVLISNRPDGEANDQPTNAELAAAARDAGLTYQEVPVVLDTINAANVRDFAKACKAGLKTHAFCRSGARSSNLYGLKKLMQGEPADVVIAGAATAGVNLTTMPAKFASVIKELTESFTSLPLQHNCSILIVGGGAGGIAVAASLLKRRPGLDIAIVEPSDEHHYQPGYTMIGGGIFKSTDVVKPEAQVIPKGVTWIKASVTHFLPESNQVVLDDDTKVSYERLVVCPGLKLNWDAVSGLRESIGKYGVTSNYDPRYAPYTWELVQSLKSGTAIFTQPPMPIKCAGAPQKALYLSADYWLKQACLDSIDIHFCNAGPVLFGVKDYVPALMQYIERYKAKLDFGHNLIKVDGPNQTATFATTDTNGQSKQREIKFDMLHVCPPQCAPDFIRNSPLADFGGWVSVDPKTLQHTRYSNIWGLGDGTNTPNAKTAAAVRKQAPTVAMNLLADIDNKNAVASYNGYGACPLTVERGKVVLAEFAYGGKLDPSLPNWILDGRGPTSLAWILKKTLMPSLYYDFMFKGHEPLVTLEKLKQETAINN